VNYGQQHYELEHMSSSQHAMSLACDLRATTVIRSGIIHFSGPVINSSTFQNTKVKYSVTQKPLCDCQENKAVAVGGDSKVCDMSRAPPTVCVCVCVCVCVHACVHRDF
jgi:hypothetical protein